MVGSGRARDSTPLSPSGSAENTRLVLGSKIRFLTSRDLTLGNPLNGVSPRMDISIARSNPKVAKDILLSHILSLKAQGHSDLNAGQLSRDLQIPYYTVREILQDLHSQGYISSLEQF